MNLHIIELSGEPRQMGRQFGEALRDQTRRFAELRMERCIAAVKRAGLKADKRLVLDVCERCLEAHRLYDEQVWQEFSGIAEGAGVEPAMLMICNGLTDIQDAARAAAGAPWAPGRKPQTAHETGGCTAWLAAPEATADDKVLAGQTWDMHADAIEYIVVVKRKPKKGPASASMTTAGCLSLVGINSAGVAAGNTNLKPVDARPGVIYLAMIHKALGQSTLAGAVNAITQAQRCSGHNYYLAGPDGEIVNVETTAGECEVIQPAGATYAHTNHYLVPRLRQLEQPDAVSPSSTWRLTRMLHVLSEQAGQIAPRGMMEVMSDPAGQGDCRICRNDPADEAPTCGAAILSPQERRMWVAQGEPRPEKFMEFSL